MNIAEVVADKHELSRLFCGDRHRLGRGEIGIDRRRNLEWGGGNFGESTRSLVDLEHGNIIAIWIQDEQEPALAVDGRGPTLEALVDRGSGNTG